MSVFPNFLIWRFHFYLPKIYIYYYLATNFWFNWFKMSGAKKHSYNLRERNPKRKHPPEEDSVEKKRPRTVSCIERLPNEMLLHIFSFLNANDLYYNVRPVCRRWKQLSMLSSNWKRVSAGNEIPRHVLHNWIQVFPKISHIHISDRTDADFILDAVSKHLTQLKTITIDNCTSSPEKSRLRCKTLCKLFTQCEKLEKITLCGVKFHLFKFFREMAERGHYMQLREVEEPTEWKKCNGDQNLNETQLEIR